VFEVAANKKLEGLSEIFKLKKMGENNIEN
jgi:hypothetical protein